MEMNSCMQHETFLFGKNEEAENDINAEDNSNKKVSNKFL